MSVSSGSGSFDQEKQEPTKISHFRLVFESSLLTPEIINHKYDGAGTEEDPYQVEYLPEDPKNAMQFSQAKKWTLMNIVAFATLALAFISSAYSGAVQSIREEFKAGEEVVILGISLFVLGFALGPLAWAPLSELYGRRNIFIISYALLVIFTGATVAAQNIQTIIILRFFAGAFGSSPLTNAGGVIADLFDADQRGTALAVFAAAPFLGPAIGPIASGFLSESAGWRWNQSLMAILAAVLLVVVFFYLPETYGPCILRRRAAALSKNSGKVYTSILEVQKGKVSAKAEFEKAMIRPWILLFREPIVLLLSIYMAIVYGTLYLLFAAFPIVFSEVRGWSVGIEGLAFIGVAVGIVAGVAYSFWDNSRYKRVAKNHDGKAPPEARLPPAILGSILLPIGLFWFAWTCQPPIPWIVCIIASAPFGLGLVLVFLSVMNYLIDAYVIYAASVLAANSALRSLFGAAFPLFTSPMYKNLGINWASSVPAFLALACVPFPYLFWKYGAKIRQNCKFAREAAEELERMQKRA